MFFDPEFGGNTPGEGNLAVTEFVLDGDSLVKASIRFNDEDVLWVDARSRPKGDTFDDNEIDLPSVVVHELGHFLGLGHVQMEREPGSVMVPTIAAGVVRRELGPGDVQRIQSIYGKCGTGG